MRSAAIDDQYAIMLEPRMRRSICGCATHPLLSSPRRRRPIATCFYCCIHRAASMVHGVCVPAFAGTSATDVALLQYELLLANDIGPGRGLALDVAAELLGRRRHRFEQLRRHEFLLERWIAQDLAHLGVDLHHHVARRAAGGGEAEPGAGLVARHSLRHGGRVRQLLDPLGAATPSTLSFFSFAGWIT